MEINNFLKEFFSIEKNKWYSLSDTDLSGMLLYTGNIIPIYLLWEPEDLTTTVQRKGKDWWWLRKQK